MMILELTYARGMRILIDGQKPKSGWHFGDDSVPGDNDGHGFSFGSGGGRNYVEVAGHKLKHLKSDVSFHETYDGHVPTRLTLEFEDKEPVTLAVVDCAWGDENETEPTRRTFKNGETIEIDEITLYLRAEG